MTAHSNLLAGIAALRTALDVPAVFASNDVGNFLRRGLTVSAFNLLETFVADRTVELIQYANRGTSQFLDLPDKLQKRALTHPLQVARTRMGFGDYDLPELRKVSLELGSSLATVGHGLNLSPWTWLWAGSNMSAEDYMTALRLFHVNPPGDNAKRLAERINVLPKQTSNPSFTLKEDLNELVQMRHQCAHVATSSVTSLWLRAVPSRVLRYAATYEILASFGAFHIHIGEPDYLADEKWLVDSRIAVRFIRQRKADVAEYAEGKTRAARVQKDNDAEALYASACSKKVPLEVVVRQDETLAVLDWAIPTVP